MGYMERLGLWGAGNPAFASFMEFMEAVGSRGVCALELVAMDMKAQGMYVARTLSYAGAPLAPAACLSAPKQAVVPERFSLAANLSVGTPRQAATIRAPCFKQTIIVCSSAPHGSSSVLTPARLPRR